MCEDYLLSFGGLMTVENDEPSTAATHAAIGGPGQRDFCVALQLAALAGHGQRCTLRTDQRRCPPVVLGANLHPAPRP